MPFNAFIQAAKDVYLENEVNIYILKIYRPIFMYRSA